MSAPSGQAEPSDAEVDAFRDGHSEYMAATFKIRGIALGAMLYEADRAGLRAAAAVSGEQA